MFAALETGQLDRLRAVAKRLYTEDRLNGDAMRDLAHVITSVLDQTIGMPDSGVLVFAPKACEHPGCGGSIDAVVCSRCRSY